jgi:colicin import membrane protein
MRASFSARLGLSVIVASAMGCTVAPILPDVTLLPTLNSQTITSADKARDALSVVGAARADIAYETRQAEIACYKIFYVNSCLSSIDIERKRKEARLREVDLVAQQVIRNERTLEKNQAIAKTQDERDSKAPMEALRREQSLEKAQDRLDTQSQKNAKALEAQAEEQKKIADGEASRKARLKGLDERNAKAKSARIEESKNREKYQRKLEATKAKQAKAKEKQKLIDAKPTPAPRLPKAPKPLKPPKPAKPVGQI